MAAPQEQVLGAYRLQERIGKGGMGEVYRATHIQLGREAAVKVLPANLATDEDFLRRFKREASSAAALAHPNILQVYDYGEQDGTPYLVMPYVRGGTLKDRFAGGKTPASQLAKYLTEVADALDYAHRKGIIHRDVKPANILIDEDDRAYLADFGIAKALEGNDNLTQAGVGVGTPEYMAPEQAQGRADPRSDLYALGIMVYQMLTGQVPFSGNTTVEVLMKHLQEPVPLSPLRGAVAQQFGPILQRALAKDPNLRYQSGREMMADVNQAMALSGFASTVVTTPTAISAVPPPGSNPAVAAPVAQTPPPVSYTPPPGGYTPPPGGYTPPPGSNPGGYVPPANAPGGVAGISNTLSLMSPNARRLLIIGIVVAVILLLCCCLILYGSALGN
jgi:serine/threonine protein kinase